MTTVKTFCRVCEPSCGLEAEVNNGEIIRLKADKEHPISKGFICHKGINSLEIHRDPDRLNFPQKRINNAYQNISWQEAITEISEKILSIKDKYGPMAFGAYIGNPMGFNALAGPAMSSFLMQLGCMKNFNAGTQDCSNKFAGSEAVFGTSTLHPVPDFEHTDYCLIIGSNPKVSHMSFISIANPMEKIKQAKKRGAQFVYVNPREIESLDDGDQLLQIKPDSDTYLLAAMLHEINRLELFDKNIIEAHGKNVQQLFNFTKDYSPEKVSKVVGITASTITETAVAFAKSKRASAFMSVGANMGRQGTLTYWLMHMLVFITGNLDRKGGNLYSTGFYHATKAGRIDTERSPFFATDFGEMRAVRGTLPGNLLADMIEEKNNPIRALIVIGGNPVLSIGGSEKLKHALEKLELLVCIDLYQNATGEHADYLLPATDMLERSDLNIIGLGLQDQPHIQYTDAITEAKHERKQEWWILGQLEKALGFKSVFDSVTDDDVSLDFLYQRIEKMMRNTGLTLEDVKTQPSQTVVLPEKTEGEFFEKHIQLEDRKVDCFPFLLHESIEHCSDIFKEMNSEDEQQVKLINLRSPYTHNSWFQNIEKIREKHPDNVLFINPVDANRLSLESGDTVKVSNKFGSIECLVSVDSRLRAQVVAMNHGWGNKESKGMKVAARFPGVNVNELLPVGLGSYEKISNQAHMTGVPVDIEKVCA